MAGETHTPLSGRERAVLDLTARGFSKEEMAAELNVSISTVKTHAKNLYEKLQAANGAHAVHRAYQYGLLTVGGTDA